jgi:hypothetical protein
MKQKPTLLDLYTARYKGNRTLPTKIRYITTFSNKFDNAIEAFLRDFLGGGREKNIMIALLESLDGMLIG